MVFFTTTMSLKVKFVAAFNALPHTVSHSHEGTGKPQKTCVDTAGHYLLDFIFVIDISITNTNPQSSTSRCPAQRAPTIIR